MGTDHTISEDQIASTVNQKVESEIAGLKSDLLEKIKAASDEQRQILELGSQKVDALLQELRGVKTETVDVLGKAKTSLTFIKTKLDEIERPEERIAETLEAHSQELKHLRDLITAKKTTFDHLFTPYGSSIYILGGLLAGVLIAIISFWMWSWFALSLYETRIYADIVKEKVKETVDTIKDKTQIQPNNGS